MKNQVFIAQSIDGYIADKEGNIDWLEIVPQDLDYGWDDFISQVDAIIMGKNTYEKILSFGIPWPYSIKVFVLSSSLKKVPEEREGKVELLQGAPKVILDMVHTKGYENLYIDGGSVVQSFLSEDLIDELIISTIPICLGGGIPLFQELPKRMLFTHVNTTVYGDTLVQTHYRRERS